MTEGEIVLVAIQQADGPRKNRPAVYLKEIRPFAYLLVCGTPSLIRLGYLATVPSIHVLGTIGSIAAVRHQRLLRSLSDFLAE